MKKSIEKINFLNKRIEIMLDNKLKIIDQCLEINKECPCSEQKCELPIENFREINFKYKKLLKDQEVKNCLDFYKLNNNISEEEFQKSFNYIFNII